MSERKTWSPAVCAICEVCGLLWVVFLYAGCAYVVFWLGHSGWWFLAATLLAGGWTCQRFRSPEQIAASKGDK